MFLWPYSVLPLTCLLCHDPSCESSHGACEYEDLPNRVPGPMRPKYQLFQNAARLVHAQQHAGTESVSKGSSIDWSSIKTRGEYSPRHLTVSEVFCSVVGAANSSL